LPAGDGDNHFIVAGGRERGHNGVDLVQTGETRSGAGEIDARVLPADESSY